MLTRPDKVKLHTLLGSYPNAVAMKDGRVKSDLVEFDFPLGGVRLVCRRVDHQDLRAVVVVAVNPQM